MSCVPDTDQQEADRLLGKPNKESTVIQVVDTGVGGSEGALGHRVGTSNSGFRASVKASHSV